MRYRASTRIAWLDPPEGSSPRRSHRDGVGVLGGGHGDDKGDQHLGMGDDGPAPAAGTAAESSMGVNLFSWSSLLRSSATSEELLLLRRGLT